ncbi:aryl-alcohol dehydrogenase-like predicted oxidoreductase [Peribacillus deserti]|uniref:Aryl-alcohol dehydrogenase-like predicted oxidoreductase n=1 Tax=Peribacillus deserti TaxID=673318 RepID=A0ABS2QJ64_9BACI|nr:aryl-alcohol dehydrogenase-like predicted oxidoreductase [Peribacillus deserti]
METRRIGTSDLYVSKIGLGCMSLGTDDHEAGRIIQTALDEGINYFDTADLYDAGENETIVGKALKPVRDQVVIATKVGNKWNKERDGWTWDPTKAYIKGAVKDSLQRLQTDYIDLYQLHGGTIEDDAEETIEAFEELKKEGYIRYYGISSIRPNVIHRFADIAPGLTSNMMQYSILDRRPEELMPLYEQKQISLIARGPVAKGLLTNKMLDKASEKIKQNGYLYYSFEELQRTLNELNTLFPDRSLNEVALQYILAHSSVASCIPGASSVDQLKENVKAANGKPLNEAELRGIKAISKADIYAEHRSE